MKKTLLSFILLTLFSISANAANAPESFANLVEKLTPAVVNISTTQTVEGADNPLGELFSYNFPGGQNSPLGDLPELFKKFYGDRENGGMGERKSTSLGSGFVIDPAGYIVTNNHVVDKADAITVIFSDDTEVPAKVIGKDTKTDIALLKVDVDRKLESVKWGNSDKARVGDWVIAIGNPFGLGGSVSAGIISARARDINAGPFDDFIQTDAAINRGNSGGPLFDIDGEVIGINSAIFSPSGGNVGIGFAVPTSLAQPVIMQLKETGHIKRGWLGVKIQTVTDEIAESLGLKKAKGALVLEITKDSPADKAGMLAGDVIVSFDNNDVTAMRKLPRIVAETEVGKKVPVVVWRKEQQKTLIVTVDELDENKEDMTSSDESEEESGSVEKLEPAKKIAGIGIKDLDDELRKRFEVDKDLKGVLVIEVDPKSPAASKPIRMGDVITAINQEPVATADEAAKIIDKAKDSDRKSVLLLLNRSGETQFIAVPVE